MFGLGKNTDGDSPGADRMVKLAPCEAIASMILNLTYDQMVTMAQEIETRYNAQEGMTLAAVMNQWAKEKRGGYVAKAAPPPVAAPAPAATSVASDEELDKMKATLMTPRDKAAGG